MYLCVAHVNVSPGNQVLLSFMGEMSLGVPAVFSELFTGYELVPDLYSNSNGRDLLSINKYRRYPP